MRLTDHDASFLYQETASGPMHGASIAVLDREVGFEPIYHHIESRLHLVPRYRQKLAFVPFNLAHPCWVDDADFDLAYHVRRHTLDGPCTVDEAIEAALVLAEPLLDRSRPLWLTYVIEGVKGHTLLLQIAHHAMVDGASGVDLSMILLDLERAAPSPPPPESPWVPAPPPSPTTLLQEALEDNLASFSRSNPFAGGAPPRTGPQMELLRRANETMSRFLSRPVLTAPWNAAPVGPRRRLEWLRYQLADLRDIRRALGGTINDVVVAVVSEAAARYLEHHREPVQDRYLRLMCPVNVRREDEAGALGNRVSGMFPEVPAWSLPVLDRLHEVRQEMERIKANREAQALELLMESQPPIPPVAMAATLLVGTPFDPAAFLPRLPRQPAVGQRPPLIGFNFTCSNVPGVQVPQYIAGAQILDTVGLLMLGGTLGYGVVVSSYNQMVYFNLVCDPELMPDLRDMRDLVAEVMAGYLEAAAAPEQAASA